MTRLRAGLPKDPENNGLPAINEALTKDPHTTHLVIMVIDCPHTDVDNEADPPTANAIARILRIEPIVSDDDAEDVAMILDRATNERIGRLPLPIDPDPEPEDGPDPES